MSADVNPDAVVRDLDAVIRERDKAREECGYEKRMRAAQREELDNFVRLKRRIQAERDALAATVERVRALHDHTKAGWDAHCVTCGQDSPCPTLRALDAPADTAPSP